MKQIIPFAHDLLRKSVQSGDIVIDATLGNGHDSLFLSELVGPNGQVIAFDVQVDAVNQAKKLFKEHGVTNVNCIINGHEFAKDELARLNITSIDGAIFNLGYLPGSDHQVTTSGTTTNSAIKQLLSLLKKQRYIVIVVYPGHPEGKQERDELTRFLKTLPANEADVFSYQMVNRSDAAPFVMAIYKK